MEESDQGSGEVTRTGSGLDWRGFAAGLLGGMVVPLVLRFTTPSGPPPPIPVAPSPAIDEPDESQPTNTWTRLSVVSGLLGAVVVPVALFFFATRVENQIKDTLGNSTLRVQRSALIATLMPSLFDGTPSKKRVAFETLLYAYPATDLLDATPLLTQLYLVEVDPVVKETYCQRLFFANVLHPSTATLAPSAAPVSAAAACATSTLVSAAPQNTPKVVPQPDVVSPPMLSGIGKKFSDPPYELCALAPPGTAIAKAVFFLVGDRSCGGWSTCKQTATEPTKVCWQFTLQGHDELPAPGQATSTGIIQWSIAK